VWGTHGGHVEYGETIAEAAVRETKEEVGMDTQFIKVIRYGESIDPPAFHRKAHLIFFHCLVESDSDEVNIDKVEIVDYRWIYPSEIGDYKTSRNSAETVKMITHSDQLEKKF
jgi:8-oxo-dGTP pyrophosphatase MutT (NUDIX family)